MWGVRAPLGLADIVQGGALSFAQKLTHTTFRNIFFVENKYGEWSRTHGHVSYDKSNGTTKMRSNVMSLLILRLLLSVAV